eukprot:7148563-Prymnesium_polylepis.1
MRYQGEQPDGRLHRWTRYVGSVSVLPTRRASMDLCCRRSSSAQGTSAQEPSPTGRRAYLRGTREVFCAYLRPSEPSGQLAWPMLCTCSPRGSCEPGGRKCATARNMKRW